jgi:hypothetical protein
MLDKIRASARWRRAMRDAQTSHRWVRFAGVGLVVAAMAWFVPWRLGAISAPPIGGVSAGAVAALTGLIVGLLSTPLLEFAWYYWRAPVRLTDELDQRVAALEQARTGRPVVRLQFDYNSKTQRARLHVTNEGDDGEFWASLLIDGDLSGRLDHAVFATWEDTDRVKTSIARGQTRTLCLAELDLGTFPFAQWQLHVTSERGRPPALRAMHTSVIGGDPSAHAPTIFLDVSLLSRPDCGERARTRCTIALYPFDAHRLRS